MNKKQDFINFLKAVLILLILILPFSTLFSQQWTEPITISFEEGINQTPYHTIDTNGIVHLVWMHKYNQQHTEIFYRRSFDYGLTWDTIIDISKNDTGFVYAPTIACNDTSEILVAWELNAYSPEVYSSFYSNDQWSLPLHLSEGLPGSSNENRCIVDSDGRYYVFWHNTFHKCGYKDTDNFSMPWSDFNTPYGDSTAVFFLWDFSLDNFNNLHWTGVKYYSDSPSLAKMTYYIYNKETDSWSLPELLTTNYVNVFFDITLDTAQNPHIAWREREQTPPIEHDFTFYRFFDGIEWTETELVVEDPKDQQIAIDGQNRKHIVQREKTPSGYQIVHYTKTDNEWLVGEIVDAADSYLYKLKLTYYENMLFLTYSHQNDDDVDPLVTKFSRYDIITAKEEYKSHLLPECKLWPNPFANRLSMEVETMQHARLWVYITDLSGRLVKEINNNELPRGKYSFVWDGTNQNGHKMPPGSYLIRMVSGKYQLTKVVQMINS